MPTLRKIKMFYDPLGRLVKTVNPDKSEQRVVYGVPDDLTVPGTVIPTPWENFTYDANDLAQITSPTNTTVPATDYFTPKSAEVDALGRTVKTKEYFDNSNYSNVIEMKYSYDVRGNLLTVTDPYNRYVFEHVYDLRTPQKDQQIPPLKTVHIDKGESTVLFDALGKPIESFDAKGAHSLSAYDTLQRPTNSWACNKTGDAITLRNYIIYGESATTPATFNLNGKTYQSYDEAGFIETPEYDFKGNLLTKKRQVIDDIFIKPSLNAYNAFVVDWTGISSILNSFVYESGFEFDALNRVTKITLPNDVNSFRKNIIPFYNRAGALEKVNYDGTDYVKHIAYNAKGQRILIAMGNDVMSRYAYDDLTFRLIRQRSESYAFSQSGNTQTYAYQSGTNKQDDKYLHDLIGNITEINLRTSTCGVGGTNSLDRTFAYDSIYRLTQATGRENVTGASYPFPGWQDQIRSNTPNTTVAYTRNYSYDKLGNIQQIQQVGTNAFTRTYNYTTGTNKLSGVTIGSNSYAFTYDNCGNQLTENVNRKFNWDYTDRLLFFRDQVGTSEPTVEAQYMYDASGQRVKKIVRKQGGLYETRVYIDGIFEFFTDEVDTQNTVHIMDNQSRIATVRLGAAIGDPTPAIKYELSDVIGSSMVLLDNVGTEVNSQEYYPFGETSFGSYAKKRYEYVGKERDEESGLYFYGARYYAPWTCRFISVDPLAEKYAQLTPYNYASNDPVTNIDIDGMQTPGQAQSQGSQPPDKAAITLRDNTAKKNIIINQDVHHAFQDKLNGTYDFKQQMIKFKAMLDANKNRAEDKLYGPNDPQFWLTQNNYNPDMAGFVEAKKNAENASGFTSFSIWFKWGSDFAANFEVGRRTTTKPVEFKNFELLNIAQAPHPVESRANAIEFKQIQTPKRISDGAGAKGFTPVFVSFTKNNFRNNLERLTGTLPENSQAHHVFPQKFESTFSSKGIDIHDPKFGTWWETTSHQKNAKAYNTAWENFLKTNPTRSQIMDYGRMIMSQYNFNVNY